MTWKSYRPSIRMTSDLLSKPTVTRKEKVRLFMRSSTYTSCPAACSSRAISAMMTAASLGVELLEHVLAADLNFALVLAGAS